jgi:ribosomal protein S18 acetylase RimI-like enzyme
MPLRSTTCEELGAVTTWIASERDCELWAGRRVSFPIELEPLADAIDFAETNAFSLIDGDRLVAFGQLLRKDASRGHLARLIVSPAHRGAGFGERLVRALLEKARAESFARVSLNVNSDNLPAVSLYLKLGFRDAPRPSGEPDWHNSRYMERAARLPGHVP